MRLSHRNQIEETFFRLLQKKVFDLSILFVKQDWSTEAAPCGVIWCVDDWKIINQP